MKKVIILLLLVPSLSYAQEDKLKPISSDEIYSLINQFIEDMEYNKMSESLYKINYCYLPKDSARFHPFCNLKEDSTLGRIFSEEDYNFMSYQLRIPAISSWDKNQIKGTRVLNKRKDDNLFPIENRFISLPLFSIDKKSVFF